MQAYFAVKVALAERMLKAKFDEEVLGKQPALGDWAEDGYRVRSFDKHGCAVEEWVTRESFENSFRPVSELEQNLVMLSSRR
jgi:hypothetical protein